MTEATASRYLLDTNICIYLLQDLDSAPADRAMLRLEACGVDRVLLSAVTAGEILIGATRRGDWNDAQEFMSQFEILPFDEECAAHYAKLPFKRASFDRLIAATALAHGLTIITNNEQDFAAIPGLSVENWTA